VATAFTTPSLMKKILPAFLTALSATRLKLVTIQQRFPVVT